MVLWTGSFVIAKEEIRGARVGRGDSKTSPRRVERHEPRLKLSRESVGKARMQLRHEIPPPMLSRLTGQWEHVVAQAPVDRGSRPLALVGCQARQQAGPKV